MATTVSPTRTWGSTRTSTGIRRPSKSWYTGANQQGTNNGWDNELVSRFIPQWNQALEDGKGAEFFNQAEQKKVDGIVTWDHKTEDGQDHQFGDIYKAGVKVGNIYDQFSDDRATANMIMGELVFDGKRKAEIYSSSDRMDRLEREIQGERQLRTESFEKGQGAIEFQDKVTERAEDFEKGYVDQAIGIGGAVGGGLLAGGAAGLVTGSITGPGALATGAIGAIAGGAGAWMNRDALTEQAARAYEITALSSETEGRIAGLMTGVSQWSGFGGKLISPVSNLTQGLNDVVAGEGGDGVSEFYRVDKQGKRTTPTWVKGLDVAGAVGDALLQFASPVGLAAYTTQMTGVIGGEVGELVFTGGKSFDYQSGKMDNIFTDEQGNFDASSAAAGIGKVGIDVVQLGMARGLAGKVNAARIEVTEQAAYGAGALGIRGISARVAGAREATLARTPLWLGGNKGLAAGEQRVRAAGFSFTKGADGTIKTGSGRATLGLLAPSEQLGALSAKVLGTRQAARAQGAYAADDFYVAAQAMAAGERKIQTILVNGAGEGYEEAVQSIFESHSHGNRVDWTEVGTSALYGWAAGVGMGAGFAARSPSADSRMFAAAQMAQLMRTGGVPLTKTEWDGLSASEKRTRSQLGSMEKQTMESAFRKFAEEQATDATAGIAGTSKMLDAIQSQVSQELAKASDRTDGSYVITQIESAGEVDLDGNLLPGAMPADAAAASGAQVGTMLMNHMRGIAIQVTRLEKNIAEITERLKDPNDPEAADLTIRKTELERSLHMATLTAKWGQAFEVQLDRHIAAMYDPAVTLAEIDAEALVLNRKLQDSFNGKIDSLDGVLLEQDDKLALSRAVAALVARDPHDSSGSYQQLVPQVSGKLTAARANDVVEVSHAILAAIRGDYDGDKVRPLNQLVLDDNEYMTIRSGGQFIGAGTSVNVGAPKWEQHNIRALADALADRDPALAAFAAQTKVSIGAAIRKHYDGVIEPDILDEVFAQFSDALNAGSKDARKVLLDGLAELAGSQITEYARSNLSNEWLWIDQLVVSSLQRFQAAYAANRSAKSKAPDTSVTPTVPRQPADSVRERKIAKGATQGISVGLLTEGDSMFRKSQKLHYSLLTSPVLSASNLDTTSDLYQLAQMYEALGQGLTTSELASIEAKDEITARVFAQLQRLSLQAQELHPQLNKMEALSLIANIAVTDIDQESDGSYTTRGQQISLTQLLLKRSVAKDRQDKRLIYDASPELQAKHRRLLAMTYPGGRDNPVNAERAFAEVVGSAQFYSLLGEDSAVFGPHLTVEQFIRMYSARSEAGRYELTQKLKGDAAYLGREGSHNLPYDLDEAISGSVSAYRAMVDTVLAVGNNRITIDMGGKEPGTLNGEIVDRSDRVTDDFREAHTEIRRALSEYTSLEGRKDGELPATTVQRLLASNPDAARAVMGLIPNATANAVFHVRNDQVFIANWVYGMLAEPDASKAEMIYWRNVLLAEWNSMGMNSLVNEEGEEGEVARRFDRLPRRMHRLLYRLNPTQQNDGGIALQRFLLQLEQATDVKEFLRWVNTTPGIRGEQAPFVAWVDDVAEFDMDKAQGGWTTSLQGAELREAVSMLKRASENLLTDLSSEKAALREDTNTILAIERVIKSDAGDTTVKLESGDRALHDRLVSAIDEAGKLGIGLGPQAMIYQTIGAVRGFYPHAHTKGENPDNVEPAGALDAMRDAYDYVTNYERVQAALTSVNLEALSSNMGDLSRDGTRTMDENGNPVEWEKPTPAGMLALLKKADTRPLARSILFPSVMERGLDGQIRPQLLVGKSLDSLLRGTSHSDLFPKNDRLSMDSALRYVSMVEAVAREHGGHFSVQRAANNIVIARTSAADHVLSFSELEEMAIQAYYEIAQVLQATGAVAATPKDPGVDPLEELLKKIRTGQRALRTGRMLGLNKPEATEWTDELLEQMIAARKTQDEVDTQELVNLLDGLSDPAEVARVEDMLERMDRDSEAFEKRARLLLSDDIVGQVVDMWSMPSAKDAKSQQDAVAKKDALLEYVMRHLNQPKWPGSTKVIIQRITQQRLDTARGGQVDLSPEEWSELSRAVIAVYLDDVVSAGAVSVSPYPDADHARDEKYFDHTFSYLVEPLMSQDSPLVKAAKDIHLRARRHGDEAPTDSQIISLLGRTLFAEFSYGDWTSDIPRASIEANQRLDSASASAAISMPGNSPKRQAVISAATRRTFQVPPETLLSNTTLTWAELTWSHFDEVRVMLPGGVVTTRPLVQLDNRFARSAVVRFTDAAGQLQSIDLLQEFPDVGRPWRPGSAQAGQPVSVADSGYVEIHTERIAWAIDRLATLHKINPNALMVDIEFFHPDSQPEGPEWMNNIYFEGTSFKLDADTHESLNTTLWFANESISPKAQAHALDASKLGKPALKVVPVPGRDEVKVVESDALVDLAKVLRAKSRMLLESDLGGTELAPEEFYNVVYKNQKLRHFVRGTTPEGVTVLWTAEQVIAYQVANPGVALPLDNAELWIPTDDVLRSMLGEQSTQGANRVFNEQLEIDLARVPTWRGVTDRMLAKFPGTASGSTAALTDTAISNRARQNQLMVRAQVDEQARAAYDTRLRFFDFLRSEIHNDRSETYEKKEGGFDANRNMTAALRHADNFLRAENIAFDWAAAGVPFIGPRSASDIGLSRLLLRDINTALDPDSFRTGWIYIEGSEAKPAAGLLSQVSLGNQKRGLRVAPGDLVSIELDSFGGNANRARERIDYFVGQGVNIVLGSSSGQADLRAEMAEYLLSADYGRIAGSGYVFQPLSRTSRYQNRRARASTLTETHGVSIENMVAIFNARGLPIQENAAWARPADERLGAIRVSMNLVPTNAFVDYNVPVTPEQIDQVRAHLRGLNDVEGRTFLRAQATEKIKGDRERQIVADQWDASWENLMQRLNTHDNAVLPQPGDTFGTGDMIPLVNSAGNVLLYRHGHKAPKNRDHVNELTARTLPSRPGAANIASYTGEREPAATTHIGQVVEFKPRSAYGLSVELNVDLQQFGNKIQLEWNGMKYILAPTPDNVHLPKHGIFPNWDISLVSDIDSLFSKEGYDGVVDNHRNAIAYFGMDFRGDVAEFFFPGRRDDEQARRDGVQLLEQMALLVDKIPVEAADELIKASALSASFRQLLPGFASGQAGLADPGWVDRLGTDSVPARIVTAMAIYLSTPGAKVEDVLTSGGFNDQSTDPAAQSRLMPRLFTQYFDNLVLADPLRVELNDRFNRQLYNPNTDGTGYQLDVDFTFKVNNADPSKYMEGFLQFAEAHSSGDNPILNGMAFDELGRQQVSQHSAAMAYQAIGADTAYKYDFAKSRLFAEGTGVTRFETEVDDKGVRQGRLNGDVWGLLTSIPVNDNSAGIEWRAQTPAEAARRDVARDAVVLYRQELEKTDENGWSKEGGRDFRKEYADIARQITRALGLKDTQIELVDYWVRQMDGRPAEREATDDQARITGKEAIEAANDILWNVKEGFSPIAGGEVPLLHIHDLQMLYRVNRLSGTWAPKVSTDSDLRADKWQDWVAVSLGTAFTSEELFDQIYLLAVDGLFHGYQNATYDLLDLPVSMDAKLSELLLDPATNRLLAEIDTYLEDHPEANRNDLIRDRKANRLRTSLDPNTDLLAMDPVVLDIQRATLDQLVGGRRIAGRYEPQQASASERVKRRAARRKWRKENGVPFMVDSSLKDLRKNGRVLIDHSTTTNALARMLINLRVGTALINPALYVSMGPEQWIRGSLDRLANILTGQATVGVTARQQARVTQAFAGAAEQRRRDLADMPKDGQGFMSMLYTELLEAPELLGITSRYSPEQLQKLQKLYVGLGQRSDFKAMIYRDLMFLRPHEPGIGRIEKWLENYAKLGSRMQDPTWGMKGNTLARRYIEAALQHILATPTLTNLDTDKLIAELSTNPTFLQTNYPEAHQAATNAIAQLRSLKATVLSKSLRSIYEPLSEHSNPVINFAGNVLLKLPLIFSGYATNVATTITGLQGLDQMTAMFVEGARKDPNSLLNRVRMKVSGKEYDELDDSGFDMSSIVEGIDLSRAFIRGGLTHTGLFVAGMMAGGLGISGEDDEAKKRRLMAKHQGVGHIYDPRAIENDFRNADAIYLDWLPYGSEATGKVTIAQPHWMLKQFISPIMGMEKFFQTGDMRHVTWGFQDALGSFPLINTLMWNDAVETAGQIEKMADAEAKKGGKTDLIAAGGLLTKVVATYERMLFENAFANALYVGFDRYDRDPYVLPLRDSSLELQGDIEGNVRGQNLGLESYIDPETGLVKQGYVGRDTNSAYLHSLAENRGTLAVVASLFTGLTGAGESDYLRYRMPIKTREMEKAPTSEADAKRQILQAYATAGGQSVLTTEEAEAIVKNKAIASGNWDAYNNRTAIAKGMVASLADWDIPLSVIGPDGREQLTMEGARAIMRGLHKNTVKLSDLSLEGAHISLEMRNDIAKEWTKEIVQEGIDMGLDETKAQSRMKRIWYGPLSDPSIQGLGDMLYSKDISYSDKRVYNQLNTTYVIGPDGMPWATGFARDKLMGALGLSPVTKQLVPEQSAMTVDRRMNSVDLINGANTGLRGLELADESRNIPTDKEIGDAIIKAIEEAGKQSYTPSTYTPSKGGGGYTPFKRRSYGRGGGGGGYYNGGYANFTRMYPLPELVTPYGNQIQFINTSNPIIRRSQTRRERVWSERGRLKPWQ